jgi:hypothetical protein
MKSDSVVLANDNPAFTLSCAPAAGAMTHESRMT